MQRQKRGRTVQFDLPDSDNSTTLTLPVGSYPPTTFLHNPSSHTSTSNNQRYNAPSLGYYDHIRDNIAAKSRLPRRTTKLNEKLITLPTTDSPSVETGAPGQQGILREDSRSDAERMGYEDREIALLPRVTGYCSCEGYNLDALALWIKRRHSRSTTKYDEALYVKYTQPFPVSPPSPPPEAPISPKRRVVRERKPAWPDPEHGLSDERAPLLSAFENRRASYSFAGVGDNNQAHQNTETVGVYDNQEVFVFDYGVVVFWNFNKENEEKYLREVSRFATKLLPSDEMETESFHFAVNPLEHKARIFNDMLTLINTNPMIKLSISHAIGQSCKMAVFETCVGKMIEATQHLPLQMAQYGDLKVSREEIVKIVGSLFKLRMDVNLISNVLDQPEYLWSAPNFTSLYNSIRKYLEISQRVRLLNSRAEIISDLMDMLGEHINRSAMSSITVIIIILIVIAIFVACCEIVAKWSRLTSEHDVGPPQHLLFLW